MVNEMQQKRPFKIPLMSSLQNSEQQLLTEVTWQKNLQLFLLLTRKLSATLLHNKFTPKSHKSKSNFKTGGKGEKEIVQNETEQ